MNRQLVVGTLLGDAWIPPLKGNAKNHSIWWTHKIDHEEYALWKANNIGIKYYTYYRKRYDKRTNNSHESITVYTTTDSRLENYRKLFYIDNKKIVTDEILNMLTPEAIAIWYCDDGNLYINKRTGYHLTLSIDGYTSEEKDIIKLYFKNKYELNFKNTQERIRITSKPQVCKFMELFSKYITCKCMRYKIYE